MDAISSVAPPGSFQFLAESSLSILTEDHLKVMKQHNFKALLPGIESWYDMGNKSMAGHLDAEHKLERVSEHVNMVLQYKRVGAWRNQAFIREMIFFRGPKRRGKGGGNEPA